MPRIPNISDAEWDVMDVVWEQHPITAQEVVKALHLKRDWSEGTIKTLISRLLKKGALRHRVEGKRYLYSPAVTRRACVKAETKSFLDRVFGGKASPMLAHFLREKRLSREEIRELQRMLREREKDS